MKRGNDWQEFLKQLAEDIVEQERIKFERTRVFMKNIQKDPDWEPPENPIKLPLVYKKDEK